MKLWELEGELQQVKPFESPNIKLEQYLTTPHLAAHTLYTAMLQGDIEDRVVLDLGTGTGMLAIASALCGASHVIGVDIDAGALSIAQENIERAQVDDTVDLVNANVFDLIGTHSSSHMHRYFTNGQVDTVVLNPPFGTRMKGADMHFLSVAVRLTRCAVYSLHKSSTRDHILRVADGWGCKAKVVAELVYDLPATYAFHRKNNQQIAVDLIRLEKRSTFNPANVIIGGGGGGGGSGCGSEATSTTTTKTSKQGSSTKTVMRNGKPVQVKVKKSSASGGASSSAGTGKKALGTRIK